MVSLANTCAVAAGPAAATVTNLAAAPEKLAPAAVTPQLLLLLSLLLHLGPLLRLLSHLIFSAETGLLSQGVLGVEGSRSSWEREERKKGKLVCLSNDLCLAQGGFFSRCGSSFQISVCPKGRSSRASFSGGAARLVTVAAAGPAATAQVLARETMQ